MTDLSSILLVNAYRIPRLFEESRGLRFRPIQLVIIASINVSDIQLSGPNEHTDPISCQAKKKFGSLNVGQYGW